MMLVSEYAPAETARARRLRVRHVTRYAYDRPIQRSTHRLHLRPVHDCKQTVLSHRLSVTPDVPVIEYEDVFGNCTARFEVNTPYTELTIRAETVVELLDVDPFAFAQLPIRPSFPLVWMPWQQKMLSPYLQPEELPDTQLQELYDYAISFVERNDHDLMETLFDINRTLFQEYRYLPGSTWLDTTPFEVFTRKCGVCQDFSNLFICLARLLGIPARYVCGYVYTGNCGTNRALSDASHAWVQLYIPDIGWKAFDPTNGALPRTDHVRVAYGRYFRDTAPTSGTLYTPAYETLNIDVEVAEVETEPPERETQPLQIAELCEAS
jgi:transglutaminase-like putative cysteine protease